MLIVGVRYEDLRRQAGSSSAWISRIAFPSYPPKISRAFLDLVVFDSDLS